MLTETETIPNGQTETVLATKPQISFGRAGARALREALKMPKLEQRLEAMKQLMAIVCKSELEEEVQGHLEDFDLRPYYSKK